MDDVAAVKKAIDVLLVPSRVSQARTTALPSGVLLLLEIASGDEEAAERAAVLTGRSVELVRRAAVFFIEQVLFADNSDSYRALGATSDATAVELRRNMALLLRWLHPDVQQEGERAIYASRVAAAWGDLKTPERRAAYDEVRSALTTESPKPRRRRKRTRRQAQPGFLKRILVGVLGRSK